MSGFDFPRLNKSLVNIILSIILLDLLGEYITLAIEYLYSWTKTLYLRAFNQG